MCNMANKELRGYVNNTWAIKAAERELVALLNVLQAGQVFK